MNVVAVGGVLYESAASVVECLDYCLYSMVDCVAAQVFYTSWNSLTTCVVHTDQRDIQFLYTLSGANLYLNNCTGRKH